MLLDDEHIKISEVQALQAKGLNMTLAQKEVLDGWYRMLPKSSGIFCSATKKTRLFTPDQQAFVRHGLLPLVTNNVPKLDQVLAIFGFDVNTVFVWEDV